LKKDTSHHTEEDLVGSLLEAIQVRVVAHLFLLFQVGADISQFGLDFGIVNGSRQKTTKGFGGGLIASFLDKETRRFGKEGHPNGENESPDELDGDGNTVGRVVWSIFGCIVDDSSEQETNCDGELVA
jgi:hypothetical protein